MSRYFSVLSSLIKRTEETNLNPKEIMKRQEAAYDYLSVVLKLLKYERMYNDKLILFNNEATLLKQKYSMEKSQSESESCIKVTQEYLIQMEKLLTQYNF